MHGVLWALLVGLAVSQLGILLTTVWLHRGLAHRALTVNGPLTVVFRVAIWITTGIRPRQWVAVHRKHHAFTDVAGDPHSPILEGFAAVQFGNVVLYRRVAKDNLTVARYARDLPADAWDRVLFDHAIIGLSIGIGMLCLVFGWQIGLVAAGIHAVSYLLLSASINAIGHTFGKQPAPVTARNSQWLALITSGEGLHNNHHAAPTSARLALASGEIDPAWWFIKPLAALGWVQIRHRDAPLAKKERAAA
jgi:stearoyl-CoA desaturase (delta-9 desaturase)